MIIVSITGPSLAESRKQIAASRRYTDIFEFRLDMMRDPDIIGLLSLVQKPAIATCRSKKDGGLFRGTERERLQILQFAAAMGFAYLDIEESSGKEFLRTFVRTVGGPQLILSAHSATTPRSVSSVFRSLAAESTAVIKLVSMVKDAADFRFVIDFLALCRKNRRRGIAIASGEAGEATRVLYRRFGGWATYASAIEGAEATEGQITARDLKRLYRADQRSESTGIFGVVGMPLGQSKGVFLHNPLFQRAGMDAVYVRFPVSNVVRFMKEIAPFLSGFSVTHPHKKKIIDHISAVDGSARGIGAVNTVVRDGNGFRGYNTDAGGALDAIEAVASVDSKNMLILGAGGAARAIAFEAMKRGGARVFLSARNAAKGRAAAREIGSEAVPFTQATRVPFDILVNATPVGMKPHTDRSPFPAEALREKIVFDAVYNPPLTKLLLDAKKAGARVIPGTEMYLNQAAKQSELYTGKKPGIRFMRKTLGFDGGNQES